MHSSMSVETHTSSFTFFDFAYEVAPYDDGRQAPYSTGCDIIDIVHINVFPRIVRADYSFRTPISVVSYSRARVIRRGALFHWNTPEHEHCVFN